MSQIIEKSTNKYITLKSALSKGILSQPNKFLLSDNVFLNKITKKTTSKAVARRLIIQNKQTLDDFIIPSNLIYNQFTKNFVSSTKPNKKKVSFIDDGRTKLINDINKKFTNKEAFDLKFGSDVLSDADLLQLIAKRPEQYTIKIGNKYYALNDNTRKRLLNLVSENMIQTQAETNSDGEVITSIVKNEKIEFIPFTPKSKNLKLKGAFFKYINLTDLDLTRYGIYQEIDEENYYDTCLIYALKMAGIDDYKLECLKHKVKNRLIPKCDIELICDIIETKIILKTDDTKNNHRSVFGKKYDKSINIGLLEEHYFLIEPYDITAYALKNYFDLCELKDYNYIYNDRRTKDKKRCIDSYDVVKILLENKDELIEEINSNDLSDIGSTPFYDKINDEIKDLNYSEKDCIINIDKKEERENKYNFKNIFFDFETYVDDNGIHIPYLCRTYDGVEEKEFLGDKCGFYMLCSLKSHTRLIAHNATYDYRFIINYLRNINEISRGTRLISATGRFKRFKIMVKDSYHLISMPLRDFSKVFNLTSIKEIMPYDLYNKETINKKFIDVNYILNNFIDDGDKDHFKDNIKKWDLLEVDNTIDIVEYSSRYCAIDCKVLYEGYKTFKKWMFESVQLNIDDILTIASLSDQYFINTGCYDGVFALSGIPQMFIQGCVVGGRTMTCNNQKILINEIINDFDAVSLYPSAMFRMDGFLKGKPKVITNLDYNEIKNKDGYFIDIKILKVGIKRDFSLMSQKNGDGIRIFKNGMENEILRVDKTSLEDLIKFHEIEFEIIRGYYFDEGFNTKIKDTIKFLFDERLRYKKEKNNIEMVYKLIMNSGYGKTIMKAPETDTKFFDDEARFEVFYSRNYNWITTYQKFDTKIKVDIVKTINDHKNRCHIGVCILSMSKRIMNEVMCLAEDNNIKLYYQDTDSIHIKDCDIKKLESIYNTKYKRELIGKNLGQFHSDFDLKGCDDVKAIKSIFLGKKCYIDVLEGTTKEGNKQIGYHIRMKGIPNKVIEYTSKKLNYNNVYDMYKDLYDGKTISFDLTNDGTKANFKFNKDYTINTLSIFTRNICFKNI